MILTVEGFRSSALPPKAFFEYIDPLSLIGYSELLSRNELEGYLRQCVTEGIPFVFKTDPFLYEGIRSWLAKRIGIHAKEITLIGSGRTGFSMAPAPEFGKRFSESSDLDFTFVSLNLFNKLRSNFEEWKMNFTKGDATPANPKQRGFWEENIRLLPKNISRGFIDTYKLPNIYDDTKCINNSVWALGERLAATATFGRKPKISTRVYAGWAEFSRQFMLNINYSISNVDSNHKELLKIRNSLL